MIIKLFPTILIILDLLASGTYLVYGNWRMFLYWLAAAVLTTVVTY